VESALRRKDRIAPSVTTLVPDGEIATGIDETLERRVAARRSRPEGSTAMRSAPAKSSCQKQWSTLDWGLMPLAPIPGQRIWALPFLTVLGYSSERYHKERGRRHKTIVDWARQMVRQLAAAGYPVVPSCFRWR